MSQSNDVVVQGGGTLPPRAEQHPPFDPCSSSWAFHQPMGHLPRALNTTGAESFQALHLGQQLLNHEQ